MASQPGGGPDVWSVYLATDDAEKTVDAATVNGGQVHVQPMVVGELGTMAVLGDPGGAGIGVWQPGLHKGFGVLGEAGAPSWFELHTRDYEGAVEFYRKVYPPIGLSTSGSKTPTPRWQRSSSSAVRSCSLPRTPHTAG